MKLNAFITTAIVCFFNIGIGHQPHQLIDTMHQMFQDMVIHKNITAMPRYYSKHFVLHSNGQTMNYLQFYQSHKKVYATDIQYQVRYDNNTWIEQGDKIAGRLWITTKTAKQTTKIQVLLIAKFYHNKVSELWELTDPNWQRLKAFKSLAH